MRPIKAASVLLWRGLLAAWLGFRYSAPVRSRQAQIDAGGIVRDNLNFRRTSASQTMARSYGVLSGRHIRNPELPIFVRDRKERVLDNGNERHFPRMYVTLQ